MFIPTNCPTCDSTLERVNDQLFCRNTSCEAKTAKIVEGFCKKLKIKGFGPKTIEKLDLSSISQLYALTAETMTDTLGLKTAEKLHAEIANKRNLEFGTLIGSLGIPLIGTVAGNKLGASINSWEEVNLSNCKAAGLGDKASDSLLNWLESEQGIDVRNLPIEFTERKASDSNVQVAVAEKGDVVITGKLNDFKNRGEAAAFLAQHGYTAKSGVTKKTTALIVEDGSTSAKTKKANDLGIPILTIKQLLSD
ncbi:NAD-dependent DNA ligase [Vibrio phage D51]